MACIVKSSVAFVTVIFNANGGSTVNSITLMSGQKLGTLPITTRTNYTFKGWYNGSSQATPDTIITQNTTFTASWEANQFTITFNSNGHGTPSFASKTVRYGEVIGALPTISDPEGHYNFVQWAYTTGQVITETTIFNKDTNMTANAHWQGVPITFSVSTNGGQFSDNTTATKSFTKRYGDSLTEFGLKRTNYIVSKFYISDIVNEFWWGDTIVTEVFSGKTLIPYWQFVATLKLKGDVTSVVQRVQVWCGGRVRYNYDNPTTDTVITVYNARILIYGKQSDWQWDVKLNKNTDATDVGTGPCFGFTMGNLVNTTGVSYLPVHYIPTENTFRVHFQTDNGTASYNASGWIIDKIKPVLFTTGKAQIYDNSDYNTPPYVPSLS